MENPWLRDSPFLPAALPASPSHPECCSGWDGGGQVGIPQCHVPSTEVQAAATVPILLPNLKCSCFNHPRHQGLFRATRRLCSPTSAPTPKLSKKPKMQATGDMFPTDWSPPPVEFLNPRVLQAGREAPAQSCLGTVGPQGPRRLACQLPEDLEQERRDSDPKGALASLEEMFWNMAGPSKKAAAPMVDTHTSVSQWPPLGLLSLPPIFGHPSLVTSPFISAPNSC